MRGGYKRHNKQQQNKYHLGRNTGNCHCCVLLMQLTQMPMFTSAASICFVTEIQVIHDDCTGGMIGQTILSRTFLRQ